VIGPGQKFLGQFFVARVRSGLVGSAIFGLGLSLKNSQIFQFFPLGSKKSHRVGSKITWVRAGLASYLRGSKVCSGWVGSGQGPSLVFKE